MKSRRMGRTEWKEDNTGDARDGRIVKGGVTGRLTEARQPIPITHRLSNRRMALMAHPFLSESDFLANAPKPNFHRVYSLAADGPCLHQAPISLLNWWD